MEVRWLEDALANVQEIYLHIAADNPTAAARMVHSIRDARNRLTQLADRDRPGRWPGTRELVLGKGSLIIPYRVHDGGVEMLRVFYAARQWPEEPPSS